jgi:hypothetical protein
LPSNLREASYQLPFPQILTSNNSEDNNTSVYM